MTGRSTNVAGVISLITAFVAAALVMGVLGAGLVMPAVGALGATALGLAQRVVGVAACGV